MSGDRSPDRIPVIVGVGEIADRPGPDAPGLDSVALMEEALRRADRDAGGGWLARADRLWIVPQISFRALAPATLLPRRLGIAPEVVEAPSADGDSPVRHLDEAARAIERGAARTCLLAGGEAVRTAARRAAAAGRDGALFTGTLASASELRHRYGLVLPADIYPLYENATRAAWGQSLAEGQAETGLIWSIASRVAAGSEGAWSREARTPEEILRPGPGNRPLAFPYTKLQVANSSVNQGAALIVTSLAAALEAGIAPARTVRIGAGASAHEAADPLARAGFARAPAMEAALRGAMARNGLTASELDHVELYSCFPCVPKMARRVLGLPAERALTVHGGMTFGGGPVANAMTHAACAMVRLLRAGGGRGLLYGNGGFCTHHHALALSAGPVPTTTGAGTDAGTSAPEPAPAEIPPLTDAVEGPAEIETYTVFHDRDGRPSHGVVLARDPEGRRAIARVDGEDRAAIGFLTDGAREPVGTRGRIARRDGLARWHPR